MKIVPDSALRRLATQRLLDPSPIAVERLEHALAGAMKAAEWVRAKRLLALRRELSAQVRDAPKELATLVRAAEIIECEYAHEPRNA